MKKSLGMKLFTVCAVATLAAVTAGAQIDPSRRTLPQDSPDAGTGDNPQVAKDRLFLHNAAEGGMAEVELGKLAAEKGSSDDVKKFGQKMVDDHTQLNDSLAPFATAMGSKPPKKLAKADQAELTKLSGLSGTDFDKEYLAYMVKDHHKDLATFQTESQMAGTPPLKAAVTKGYTMIQEHTTMVDALAKSNGLAVPSK